MGMRVKFTLCITAAGMCAPLFFVVHCNEREVRDPSACWQLQLRASSLS